MSIAMQGQNHRLTNESDRYFEFMDTVDEWSTSMRTGSEKVRY